jgi:signal transduction histidine kinase
MNNPVNDVGSVSTSKIADDKIANEVVKVNLSPKDIADLSKETVNLSAHEVRTLLTIMRNYLWVMTYQKDEQIGPKTRRNLSIVAYTLEYLVMLVENELIVTKIDSKAISVSHDDFNLMDLTNELLADFGPLATNSEITLSIDPSIPKAIVNGDFQKTKDAVGRLISNSLKFTPPRGRIVLKVAESDDGEYFEISVSDTGPGIAKPDQSKLFKKYGRLASDFASPSQAETGAGLGLYIAKNYIELQSGKIIIKSDAGAGSIFVVSLPKSKDANVVTN